jgi:hypothetical protein
VAAAAGASVARACVLACYDLAEMGSHMGVGVVCLVAPRTVSAWASFPPPWL